MSETVPKWDDLTEEEKRKILAGEPIDIDGIMYKINPHEMECSVTVKRNDGTIEHY